MRTTRPSASEVDDLASNYQAQQAVNNITAENLSELRRELIELVEAFGAVPPRATKSKRLSGSRYDVTASFPQRVEVDKHAAEKLHLACLAAGRPSLFKKLFRRESVFMLAPGARDLVTRGRLPEGAPRNLRALFYRALAVEAQAPSLEVELNKEAKKAAAADPGKDAA
jgi:hypothetical protein